MVRLGTESHYKNGSLITWNFCKVIQLLAGVSRRIAKGSFHLENPTQ